MSLINCSEFQDSYQVNKLIGAAPGYVGYTDKPADNAKQYLTQEKLDKWQTPDLKLNVLLIDELEKAD